MFEYKQAETDKELKQILELQKKNLPKNLTGEQKNSQGFVTVNHDFDTLHKMNLLENAVIAKADDSVIGYLLAMRPELRNDIEVLVPMFNTFDKLEYKGKQLSDYNYIVVGQVCVAREYRGVGILDEMYKKYKELLSGKYDFAVTEIDTENLRSINAHKRIGFDLLHNYTSPDKRNWDIIIWDWT
ncbi:MAG: GNAT family N-acetyltransferase [Bacteroidetes bacterium]|nr:GNAT family N-acetyltransferase [Bacteroidota bacterium]